MSIAVGLGMLAASAASSKGFGLFGPSQDTRDHRQVEQQRKLTKIQEEANRRLMQDSYGLQKDMYNHQYEMNTPEAMRKRYEEAGMNPALAYTQGGVGGVSGGSGGASVSGATASDSASQTSAEASKEQAVNQRIGMALQHRMQESQIALNESQAEKNIKEAENVGAKTTTEEQTRELLKENMKQAGIEKWFQNEATKWKLQETGHGENNERGVMMNEKLGESLSIHAGSIYNQEMVKALVKTQAETGKLNADEALTTEKALGYYRELLVAEQKGNADETKAIAIKLAAEHSTGEYTNWKTWVSVAKDAIGATADIIKLGM